MTAPPHGSLTLGRAVEEEEEEDEDEDEAATATDEDNIVWDWVA